MDFLQNDILTVLMCIASLIIIFEKAPVIVRGVKNMIIKFARVMKENMTVLALITNCILIALAFINGLF
ncbi:MAG TPA: hypothetical protein DCS30_13980 [Rhizobiales bacterium]|jgi:hypothetical protein|nr:hypothetical protein [Hyphomicrobiales bacterium]